MNHLIAECRRSTPVTAAVEVSARMTADEIMAQVAHRSSPHLFMVFQTVDTVTRSPLSIGIINMFSVIFNTVPFARKELETEIARAVSRFKQPEWCVSQIRAVLDQGQNFVSAAHIEVSRVMPEF